MKHIGQLRGQIEVAHRTICASPKTAVGVLACAFAAGATSAIWFIYFFILQKPTS